MNAANSHGKLRINDLHSPSRFFITKHQNVSVYKPMPINYQRHLNASKRLHISISLGPRGES